MSFLSSPPTPCAWNSLTTKLNPSGEFDVDSQISFRKAEHVNLILAEAAGAGTLRDWIKPDDLVITAPFCKERGTYASSPPPGKCGGGRRLLPGHP